jgi:serine/threonine protein kinase
MRQLRGRHLEDPIKEISAMQLVGDYHPNVLGAMEVLQDDAYLYTVMPFCSGGDLFGRIMTEENHVVDESKARVWFQQLLAGLLHLQRKGVCHRDLSLENLLVLDDKLVIIDLGMALRVPYTDPSNIGCVTDVSEGTERRLMVAQGQGGKLMYMSPEVVSREEVFDGFSVDLWASAVILFVLVVGMAPFKWAHESDKRYAKIAKGGMKELLAGHHISLSEEACDLLQNMLWHDPRKRLTLAHVMNHPWVKGKRFGARTIIPKRTTTPHQTQSRFRSAMHA